MIKVYSKFEIIEVSADSKATLLDVLRNANIAVDSPCGGVGTCAKCTVEIRECGKDYWEKALACQISADEGLEVRVDGGPLEGSGVGEGANYSAMNISLQGLCSSHGASSEGAAFGTATPASNLGLAFDIGTTTIVGRLYNMDSQTLLAQIGLENPQRTYGADVISRLSAVQSGHLKALSGCVNDAITKAIAALLQQACATSDAALSASQINSAVIAGNTVMECLACAIDPSPIGRAPFTPPSLFGELESISALEQCKAGAREAFISPCVSGYVGGDITADLLICAGNSGNALLIDLGTNGELALIAGNKIICCATAAGPVFEGANITFGMTARTGAISEVSLNGDELHITTIGQGAAKGICGSGLVDAIALLLDAGVIEESGLLLESDEVAPVTPPAILSRLGEYEDAPAFWLTPEVAITQKDIRNYQLAKAAIAAGVYTLLQNNSLNFTDIDSVYIAGGFGQHINIENAATTGLIPRELSPVAKSVGNIAIEGISQALFDPQKSALAELAKRCSYIELSGLAAFNEAYIDHMEF